MPTYNHVCEDEDCAFEFEDFYSITKDPPTTCPKCGKETIKRVISQNSSRGVVELTGQDYRDKVKSDAAAYKKEVHSSEKAYANALGESKYETLTKQLEKSKKE